MPPAEPLAGYVDTDLSWDGGLDRDRYLVFAGGSARGAAGIPRVEADGGEIVFCAEREGRVDLRGSVCASRRAGDLPPIMVEGGPRLAAAFLQAGLVDRWLQLRRPYLGAGVGWPPDDRVVNCRRRAFI